MSGEDINLSNIKFPEFYRWVCGLSALGSEAYYVLVMDVIRTHYLQKNALLIRPYNFRKTAKTKIEIHMQNCLETAIKKDKAEELDKILAVGKTFNIFSESLLREKLRQIKFNSQPAIAQKIKAFLKERKLNVFPCEEKLQFDAIFQAWVTRLNSEKALKDAQVFLSAISVLQEELNNSNHCSRSLSYP